MKESSNQIGDVPSDFAIDEAEVELRKSFFCFGEQDANYLKSLHDPFTRNLQQRFTNAFYAHLQHFDKPRELLADEDTVARLKLSQSAYFHSLTAGDYGVEYVHSRLKIGVSHERLGLSPHWYIGAYCQYLTVLLPEVWALFSDQPERFIATWQALQKLVLFDISLAMETYVEAACQRLTAEHDRAELVRHEAQSHAERLEQQAIEIQRLSSIIGLPSTAITARFYGCKTLHEDNPDIFETFSTRYGQLLDLAVNAAKEKTDLKLDKELRALVDRLGLLKAGPRDVVEIHSVVMKKKLAAPTQHSQLYLDEGRVMAFEMLGYLTSFYRKFYLRPHDDSSVAYLTGNNTTSQ